MSNKIELLQPKVRDALKKAMSDMDSSGIRYVITSTLRTIEEQQALYAQGRIPLKEVNRFRQIAGMPDLPDAENGYTVTNCDGATYKSNHQGGMAVDIVPVDARGRPYWPIPGAAAWKPISEAMKKQGFEWGGDWVKFPDFPHYEMK